MSDSQREEEFCNHVFEVLKGKITGSSEDVVYDNRPSSVFFVSNLAHTKTDLKGSYADIHTKISIRSFQISFSMCQIGYKN